MTPNKIAMRRLPSFASYALSGALIALLAACATPTPPAESPSPANSSQSREAPTAEQPEPRAYRSPFIEPPGVFFADVTQATLSTTICVPGWTATVRPSTSFTQGVKRKLLVQAGVDSSVILKYELDHFVPLALGGHPRSIDNLWLQSWDGPGSARIKDRLERTLQLMVCSGKLTLHAARIAIQNDWKAAYRKFIGGRPASRDLEEEVVE